jgi:hypothetical protein
MTKKLFWSLAALVAVAFGGTALAGSNEGPPGSVVVATDHAAAVLGQMGITVPTRSCLAQPKRPGCPAVDHVVITPSASDANPTVYGPAASGGFSQEGAGLRRRLQTTQVTYACAVNASDPFVYDVAKTTGKNYCISGVGVQSMELWTDILRWNGADGRWYSLNECYTSKVGSGTISCTTSFNCYHPNTLRSYMGSASGYAVIKGVGYFGTDRSGISSDYCY